MTTPAKERTRFGKSRREQVSRAAQATLNPKERQFDPIDVLRASTEGRIPQLLPFKYARMKASPFAFENWRISRADCRGTNRLRPLGLMCAPNWMKNWKLLPDKGS